METYVQWATILSPIIAVLLAWWTSRSGARDTARLVSCVKKLIQIQIQLKLLDLKKEADEEHAQFKNLSKRSRSLNRQESVNYEKWPIETIKEHEEKERDIEDKIDYSFDRRVVITEMMSELNKMNKIIMTM